jgi:TM1410 hypothetical-related protein.
VPHCIGVQGRGRRKYGKVEVACALPVQRERAVLGATGALVGADDDAGAGRARVRERGLAAGLKNDLDQIPDLLADFEWQINEQCFDYNECDALSAFVKAGKPVFNIEYDLDTTAFCPQANALNFNSMKKNLALDAPRWPCR